MSIANFNCLHGMCVFICVYFVNHLFVSSRCPILIQTNWSSIVVFVLGIFRAYICLWCIWTQYMVLLLFPCNCYVYVLINYELNCLYIVYSFILFTGVYVFENCSSMHSSWVHLMCTFLCLFSYRSVRSVSSWKILNKSTQ